MNDTPHPARTAAAQAARRAATTDRLAAAPRPAGLDALLDHVAANLPDEDDTPTGQRFPCGITVFCDHCGAETRGDYIVTDAMTKAQRLDVARNHLRNNAGWSGDENVDYCPDCTKANRATAEQQAAAEFDAGTALLVGEQVTAYAVSVRAGALNEGADAINALPQDYECDPGRGDAAKLLRRMAGAKEDPAAKLETPRPNDDQLADTIRDTLAAYLDEIEPGDEDTDDMAHIVVHAIRKAARATTADGDQGHAEPAPPTAPDRPAAEIIREQHDNITFNRGNMVAALRDALLDPAQHTPASATAAARVLLAETADQITALGGARGWSTWAADYIHPDRTFVDPGADDDQAEEQPAAPAAEEQPAFHLPPLAVPCPRCKAARGQLCTSHGGTRDRHHDVHQARTAAYREQEAGR
ncbi:zinc finger domain-containing protein [Streptomyces sp. MMS24-I29]|uniref:zinc finger domain-containing protein n=1 Tax=Streptomyces sp. MMS24-I29 TaxID=3351480 RepID=UPI003C79A929